MLKKILFSSMIIVLAGGALISCGHDSDVQNASYLAALANLASAETPLFPNFSVTCSSRSNCSPSVAMVAVQKNEALGSCTGFLTDDGYFATNDHCLPEGAVSGSSCHGSMEILFPAVSGYAAERVRCEQVVWRSGDSEEHNPLTVDTAFLKLSRPVSRPSLSFSHAGFSQGELATVYKVNPYPVGYDGMSGILESKTCRVVQKSFLFPSLDGKSSLGFVLTEPKGGDCEIVSGNSGSPVVDSDGKVRGIVHHSNRATDFGKIVSKFFAALLGFNSGPDFHNRPFAVATNFSCVKGPSEPTYIAPVECSQAVNAQYQSQRRDENKKAGLDKILNQLNDTAESWGKDNFPMFGWKMGSVKTGLLIQRDVFIPMPYCTRPVGLDRREYKGRFFGLGHRDNFEADQTYWPAYAVDIGSLDEELQLSFSIRRTSETLFYDLSFSPSAIASEVPAHVGIKGHGLIFTHDIVNDELKPCPKN